MMKNRIRSYYRYQRNRAIQRKHRILICRWGWTEVKKLYSKDNKEGISLGKLSKGKIHCSCWMCRRKSYDEYSHRDKKRMSGMEEQLRDYQLKH